jgi:opacity protein-like surface antigen
MEILMKLPGKSAYALIGILAFTNVALADGSLKELLPATKKLYVGIFGGGGSSNNFDIAQYGTAFFTEAEGGPLAVNAFGHVKSHSADFGGAELGYQGQAIVICTHFHWTLIPAIEIEGYYIGKSSLSETLSNTTERLAEHDFDVTYPVKRSVFLTNAILTFNQDKLPIHPYFGLGIGGAIASISDASSLQTDPPEADINHYNANTSDSDATFAGQIKMGLSYNVTDAITVFAEYRWLYLASTDFTFGSTVYSSHASTSSWQVAFDPQNYNFGSLGIRYNL